VAPEPLVLSPLHLYPLHAGNAWSYDVDDGSESSTLAVSRVDVVHGPIATVVTGDKRIEYEVREEGIYVVSDDAWLLRLPLEVGTAWPGRGGRHARLASTDAAVETPAGSFTGCVEIVETGGKLELEVRTTYCPFVGPVAVDSTMRSTVSDREITVRARLRGYQVDVTSLTR